MKRYITDRIDLYSTDDITAYNVSADFEVDVDSGPAEPYTYGWSRGEEVSAEATLDQVTLGKMRLKRCAAVAIFGASTVAEAEAYVADKFVNGEYK